jgi:hypothetical protein
MPVSNIQLMGVSFWGTLILAEISLRFFGVYATNTEKKYSGGYHSPYAFSDHRLLEMRPPNAIIVENKKEFIHTIHTNSLRLNDIEWNLVSDSACRIACFGDSFTEGYGAVSDSSYPELLQKLLKSTDVMRCGMQSCDPLYEYETLKQKILPYHPNIVTLTINATDIDDVITKGGFERFCEDGIIRAPKGPWWETMYEYSFIVRIIAHNIFRVDYLLLTKSQRLKSVEKSINTLEHSLDLFHGLCLKNKIRCIFLFHPCVFEIIQDSMECNPIQQYVQKKGYEEIDLFSFYKKHGIKPENVNNYYWSIDGHHNSAGYALFAKGIACYLNRDTL